jgi:small subunit ribosomal protein S20
MPNIKSSKKRMQLSRVAATRNRAKRSRLRTAIKLVRQADTPETGEQRLREATALLDRAATRRLMHPNRVARVKSQLARHVRELGAS